MKRFLSLLCLLSCLAYGQGDFKLQHTLQAHLAFSNDSALSPDGTTLFVAARSYIHVFDAGTGTLVKTLRASDHPVWNLAMSPNGRYLASGGWLGETLLWNLRDDSFVRLNGDNGSVDALSFSPEGRILATATRGGAVNVWDVASGKRSLLIGFENNVDTLDFSNDGRFLATGDRAGGIAYFELGPLLARFDGGSLDAATHALQQFEFSTNPVTTVRFSPDDKYLVGATTLEDGWTPLIFWNVATGEESFIKDIDSVALDLAFSSAGGSFITANGREDTATLWSYPGSRRLINFFQLERVTSAHLSQDGRRAYTAGDEPNVFIWDVDTQTRMRELALPADSTTVLTLDPTGSTLLTAGQEGDVLLWDVATTRLTMTLSGSRGPVKAAAFLSLGRVVSVGADDLITVWGADGHPLEFKRLPEEQAEDFALSALAASPDGTLVVTGTEEGAIHAWDVGATELKHRYTLNLLANAHEVYAVAFHPDGTTFAVASDNDHVQIYAAEDGALVAEYPTKSQKPVSVLYSPDGSKLAVGLDNNLIYVYDLSNEGPRRLLSKPNASDRRRVIGLSFSADGKTLAAISNDDEVTVWDLSRMALVQRLSVENTAGGVALSPSAADLFVGSGNSSEGGSISIYHR